MAQPVWSLKHGHPRDHAIHFGVCVLRDYGIWFPFIEGQTFTSIATTSSASTCTIGHQGWTRVPSWHPYISLPPTSEHLQCWSSPTVVLTLSNALTVFWPYELVMECGECSSSHGPAGSHTSVSPSSRPSGGPNGPSGPRVRLFGSNGMRGDLCPNPWSRPVRTSENG